MFQAKANSGLFKWAYGCNFEGNNIDTLPIPTVISCGEMCASNLNCDRFSYDMALLTCHLKQWPTSDNPQPKETIRYSCGYVIGASIDSSN